MNNALKTLAFLLTLHVQNATPWVGPNNRCETNCEDNSEASKKIAVFFLCAFVAVAICTACCLNRKKMAEAMKLCCGSLFSMPSETAWFTAGAPISSSQTLVGLES